MDEMFSVILFYWFFAAIFFGFLGFIVDGADGAGWGFLLGPLGLIIAAILKLNRTMSGHGDKTVRTNKLHEFMKANKNAAIGLVIFTALFPVLSAILTGLEGLATLVIFWPLAAFQFKKLLVDHHWKK